MDPDVFIGNFVVFLFVDFNTKYIFPQTGADNHADGADLISIRCGFPQFEPVIFTGYSVLFPMVVGRAGLNFGGIKIMSHA
ncbi:MAG TPA: hypothetical protein PLU11_06635 [Chitinophagaceae bacterium]|nr:hypothetical protein [Chitinophagaceae bacterium]HPN58829.1 hypothetical protein [Chitinophagaceae bacterium]